MHLYKGDLLDMNEKGRARSTLSRRPYLLLCRPYGLFLLHISTDIGLLHYFLAVLDVDAAGQRIEVATQIAAIDAVYT